MTELSEKRNGPRGIQIEERDILGALEAAGGHQKHAAEKLHVSQAWLAKWLSRNGYSPRVKWVKEGQPA